MRIRTLIPLVITLAALALAAACGGDDSPSATPGVSLSSATTAASGSPSSQGANATPTPTIQPQIPPQILVTPGRTLPAATHNALGVFDAVTYFKQELNGDIPVRKPCAGIDVLTGILDCTAAGYGTIAVDPIPVGAQTWDCGALLKPAGDFFGVSCTGPGVSYIWAIQT